VPFGGAAVDLVASGQARSCCKEAFMGQFVPGAVTPSDGYAIVTVRGDLDARSALRLWQYLSYLLLQGRHHIVLDLAGMVLIDSAGVDVLQAASTRARRDGGDLVLRSARPTVADVLELAGLSQAPRTDAPRVR
jgi:anti-sigma B factor antagonist